MANGSGRPRRRKTNIREVTIFNMVLPPAVNRLCPDLELCQVSVSIRMGGDGGHVLNEARAFGIIDKVCIHGRVSRAKVLSALRGAGVSVVIASVFEEKADPLDEYIVTGKLFEALGLGTPVLFIGPSGTDADAITEATGLVRKLPAKDVEGMTTLFQEVMSGKIPVVKRLETYAWPNLIKGFDNVLRQVIRRNTGSS